MLLIYIIIQVKHKVEKSSLICGFTVQVWTEDTFTSCLFIIFSSESRDNWTDQSRTLNCLTIKTLGCLVCLLKIIVLLLCPNIEGLSIKRIKLLCEILVEREIQNFLIHPSRFYIQLSDKLIKSVTSSLLFFIQTQRSTPTKIITITMAVTIEI